MVKIGIVGKGFVGSAVCEGFEHPDNKLYVVDPKIEDSLTLEELLLLNPDFIFVCVPTPVRNVIKLNSVDSANYGSCDTSIVSKILDKISQYITLDRMPTIVVKSTITPDFWSTIPDNLDVVYNPELLREVSASEDFKKPPCVILGGDRLFTRHVEELYKEHSNVHQLTPYIHTTHKNASMFKYTINCWLATKVAFFNQIYMLMLETGMTHDDYEQLVTMVSADPRIGSSHMQVPGPDGNFGFGGHCFPKDTLAFLTYAMNNAGVDLSILNEVISFNNYVRDPYA